MKEFGNTALNRGETRVVLIADDDPGSRLLGRVALEQAGFIVEEAENGSMALSTFKSVRPDIVLLDVNMPKLDGFAVCQELRKYPGGERTPILMLTGLDDLNSINRAYDVGATDFLTKPVNWVIVRERVRYMVRAKEAVEARLKSDAENRALLNAIPDQMFRVSADGTFLDYRPSSESKVPIISGDCQGRSVAEVFPAEVADMCMEQVQQVLRTGQTRIFEYPLQVEGKVLEHEARTVMSGENEALAIVRDVTERNRAIRALRWERDFVSAILNTASALVLVRDRWGRIVRFNRACERITGYSFEEVKNKQVWDFFLEEEEARQEKTAFGRLLNEREAEAYENHWQTQSRGRRLIRWSNSTLLGAEGRVSHVISTGIDITQQKRAQEQIRFLAFHDGLTGLPNRILFQEQLQESLAHCQRHGRQLAVMFLDLDHFKNINDTFGHARGDLVLKEIAHRLEEGVLDEEGVKNSSVGRFGGDEFTVLLADIGGSDEVARLAQLLLDILSVPFVIDDHEIVVTASLGISLFPGDGTESSTLLKKADMAMYYAKDLRKNSYGFCSQSRSGTSLERLELEGELHKALKSDQLRLFYQPKIHAETAEVTGAEALLRWEHPKKGLLLPREFVQMAEEIGLILPIGEWVLRSVCDLIMARLAADLPQVPVAVNLSGLQFRQKNLLDVITKIVKETSVPPGMLELEITESTIMHEESHAIRSMIQLKELGFGLSIDDFGTGYSSLSHLKNFPVDILKIDRSFIRDIADNVDDLAIATAIINMAHCLNLKVVAEGVENSQQLKLLRSNGCDEVQGFFFFEPLSEREFLHLQDQIGMRPDLLLTEKSRSAHKLFLIRQNGPELAALSRPAHPGQKAWEGLRNRSGSRRAGP